MPSYVGGRRLPLSVAARYMIVDVDTMRPTRHARYSLATVIDALGRVLEGTGPLSRDPKEWDRDFVVLDEWHDPVPRSRLITELRNR